MKIETGLILIVGMLFACGTIEETKIDTDTLTAESLAGKSFRFSWKHGEEEGFNGIATLNEDGTISGIGSPNETYWEVSDTGNLLFKHSDGRISSVYENFNATEKGYVFEVDPAGEMVWKFANPEVNEQGERLNVWRMTRLPPSAREAYESMECDR